MHDQNNLESDAERDIDASSFSYDELILFFFTHPITDGYWKLNNDGRPLGNCNFVEFEKPEALVANLTRLFLDSREISRRVSIPALDHGFDAIVSSGLFNLCRVTWDDSVPLQTRLGCIRSMYRPFADFLANCKVEFENQAFYMWWDNILQEFWTVQSRQRGNEECRYDLLSTGDTEVLDCMLETLIRILELDDERCQTSAIHGINHLRHPRGPAIVQKFIDENRGRMTEDRLKWVELCRDNKYM
jgi:hypothetical protein